MTHGRAIIRVLLLCLTSGSLYLLWLLGVPLVNATPALSYRWRSFIFRAWAKGLTRILGLRVDVRGQPPAAPFFLVANHLSYLDVVVLAAHVAGRFIAKREVEDWPLVGRLCRSMRTIFINRASRQDIPRVNGLIKTALARGEGIILFAEGTSTPGDRVLPFNAALLAPAASAQQPVACASLSYRTPQGEPPAHLAVCWWGDMTFLQHVWELCHLSTIMATLTFSPRTIQTSDRKELARQAWQAVNEQFIPVVETEQAWSAKAS